MVNIDKNIINKFSRYADSYHKRSFVQKEIANELFDYFTQRFTPGSELYNILDIGCGSGHLTKRIADYFEKSILYSIDISPEMIKLAKKNVGEKSNITWIVNDFAKEKFDTSFFDLIFSSSALHWLIDKNPFKKISGILKNDGKFCAAIMCKGTLKELHESREYVVPQKKSFKSMPEQDDIIALIRDSGLNVIDCNKISKTIFYDNATDVLNDIKKQGLTGGAYSYGKNLLTRKELKNIIEYYNKNFFVKDKGVSLTYNILYIFAGKQVI